MRVFLPLVFLLGCMTAQVQQAESAAHAALVAADQAVVLAEQHPEQVQEALSAMQALAAKSPAAQAAIGTAASHLTQGNMENAHAVLSAAIQDVTPVPK